MPGRTTRKCVCLTGKAGMARERKKGGRYGRTTERKSYGKEGKARKRDAKVPCCFLSDWRGPAFPLYASSFITHTHTHFEQWFPGSYSNLKY